MAYITDCAHLDEARRKLGKGKRRQRSAASLSSSQRDENLDGDDIAAAVRSFTGR